MSDPFKRVAPGQPVRFNARAHNAMLGAGEQAVGVGGFAAGEPGPRPQSAWIVPVLNATGADLGRASVVGLDGPIVDPSDNLDGFLSGVTFRGIVPTSTHVLGKFAVLVDPVADGAIDRAWIAGAYQVRINVSDEGHSCVVAAAGQTGYLASAETGPAMILWREGGTGEQWAIVRRAAGCVAGEDPDPGGQPCDPCPIPDDLELDILFPADASHYPGVGDLTCFHASVPLTLVDKPLRAAGWTGVSVQIASRFWYAEVCAPYLQSRVNCTPAAGLVGAYYGARVLLFCCEGTVEVFPTREFPLGDPVGKIVLAVSSSGADTGWFDEGAIGPGTPYDICEGYRGSCESCNPILPYIDHGAYANIGTIPDYNASAESCGCDPLDLTFDDPIATGITTPIPWTASVRASGTSPGPCQIDPPPCEDGCWARVTYIDQCPDFCTPGTFSVYDPVDDLTYGPFGWIIEESDDDPPGCLRRRASARVCAPSPTGTRDFQFIDHTAGDAVVATATVTDCADATVVDGDPPGVGKLVVCVTGCPEGPLVGVVVSVVIEPAGGGDVIGTGFGITDVDGCAVCLVNLPATSSDCDITIDLDPTEAAPGYARSTTVREDVPLPGANRTCELYPLPGGEIAAAIDEDWVCTCLGPAPKCMTWSGNGDPIELHYDAGDGGKWEGVETVAGSDAVDGVYCLELGGGSAELLVQLRIEVDGEDDCVVVAERGAPACLLYPDGTFAPPCTDAGSYSSTPRLASSTIGEPAPYTITGTKSISPTPWGPSGAFPGFTFGSEWTTPDGDPDPFACEAPAEAYTPSEVSSTPCAGGMMMMGFASFAEPDAGSPDAAPPEPPLPSPLRMAGQIVRHGAAEVRRAAQKLPPIASVEEQARRWEACHGCDHFRASDKRCGMLTGCGCHLARAIPRAAKSCPIGKWGAEAPPVTPPTGG